MIDIEHVHGLGLFVDSVADAVLAPTSSPLPFERLLQRGAHSSRIDSKCAEDELDTGSRHRLGQLVGQPASGASGDDDPEAHPGRS